MWEIKWAIQMEVCINNGIGSDKVGNQDGSMYVNKI
jgi:hypothetical protein